MAARCPQCSTRLAQGASVCPKCGFDLAAATGPASLPPVETQPVSPPRQQEIKLTIPPWLTVDWGTPARAALLTIAIGVGLQYLVGLLLVIGALIVNPRDVPLGAIARVPAAVWLGFNLGVRSITIPLTGVLWIRFSVRRVGRLLGRDITVERNKVVEAAAKFAVVYALLELAIAIALKSFTPEVALGVEPGSVFPGFGVVPDPVGAFFFGLLVGFVAGIFLFTVCSGRPLREMWPIRIDAQIPKSVMAVWRGTLTALKIAIPGMAVFMFLTFILSLVSDGVPPRTILGFIPTFFAAMILWTGVDTGFLGFLIAMQLFLGSRVGGFFFFSGAGLGLSNPRWIYSGIAIPLIALFIAGMRVARETRPPTPLDAAKQGALVGIPLAILCLVFASLHSTELGGAFVGRAFLVPFLWGAASAAGAFFEVAQHTPEQPVPEQPA
jgi:hypothetical protein